MQAVLNKPLRTKFMGRRPKPVQTPFVSLLIEEMDKRDLNQQQLAIRSGLVQGTISDWIRGRKNIGRETVPQLVTGLVGPREIHPEEYDSLESKIIRAVWPTPQTTAEIDRLHMEAIYYKYENTSGLIREIVNTALGISHAGIDTPQPPIETNLDTKQLISSEFPNKKSGENHMMGIEVKRGDVVQKDDSAAPLRPEEIELTARGESILVKFITEQPDRVEKLSETARRELARTISDVVESALSEQSDVGKISK